MIKVLYFARLREQLNSSGEALELEPGVTDVNGLTRFLRMRGGVWEETLGRRSETVLIAVNQEMAREDTPLKDGDEVAYFPPVTGG